MKILIVEDDATSLKLARLVLEDAGHGISEHRTAELALESIKSNPPDLILLDLALPGMNGMDLAKLLKDDVATREIPIVALTCYPDRFAKEMVLKSGCDAYLVKPIDTRQLPAQIAQIAAG